MRLIARWRGPAPTTTPEFAGHVRHAFGFLEQEYGFTCVVESSQAYARWVEYRKPSVTILVQYELGSAPSVALEAPSSPEPGLRRTFGLHELEQEITRRGLYKKRPSAPGTIEESLAELAATLQAVGSDVLNGNFEVLFKRQRRHVNAVRRNRPVSGT